MPFDPSPGARRPTVAVIGAGISGLGAAHALADRFDVTVFEAEPRLGGHARTVFAGRGGRVAVDTGFIVYNTVTYPRFSRLLEDLGVETQESDMSFSAVVDDGRIEYGVHSLATLFAQKRNLLSPAYLAFARDLLRFGAIAADPKHDRATPLGAWLAAHRFGAAFRDYYITPLAGAIWSASPAQMLDFPAETLLAFFRNHHLLCADDRIAWRTIVGGSREYVSRLAHALTARGVTIRTGAPVRQVARAEDVIVLSDAGAERFDAVALACHAPQSLALLADPSQEEHAVLSALRYQGGRIVLHDDARHMPKRKAVWSAWNTRQRGRNRASVTYWMNRLQNLPAETPLFATLNPLDPIPEERIFDAVDFEHPLFDRTAIEAQRRLPALQGARRTYFCGAYTRYGFHEDGLMSGLAIAQRLKAATWT
ncbi:MAG: NAD(P)/FAD-dependent oxidoreductase [Hyphomonadaceae bacterium]